uniref:Serine/threonine-protein kinase PLK n=1 Tax=Panagrolaimus sp. JU765 TaxID=591449 RepID=A0AC34QTZ3_9BILA
MASKKPNQPPVPERIVDRHGNVYSKGKYLGRGGFARCYEFLDRQKHIYAAKAVAKCMLIKPGNREKMVQEVDIHKQLDHPHVVRLFVNLEDSENVYMLLELCSNRSMMEMQKRRGHVTEPEARYYMKQIVNGVAYLHDKLIIHRDLKLGNVFLDKHMVCKIGDFGLATKLSHKDERKDTVCGTPNYIAPEMLHRQKHSFEVDIWALGCILYTLLVGQPPFETTSLQTTYNRIKSNSYRLPSIVGVEATVLIRQLLHPEFKKRPTIHKVPSFRFWDGYCPESLPVACLTVAPKINNKLVCGGMAEQHVFAEPMDAKMVVNSVGGDHPQDAVSMLITHRETDKRVPKAYAIYLNHLIRVKLLDIWSQMQMEVDNQGLDAMAQNPDSEFETPRFAPPFFVTRWVDYSDKYGLGYQLADNSVGVLFNDGTKIMIDPAEVNLTYVERDGTEKYYKYNHAPDVHHKKIQLLSHFSEYMREQLLEASNKNIEPGADIARAPLLNYWFRLKTVIVLHLSNGIVQVNFFDDHMKFIFCPMVQALTVITHDRVMHTYHFDCLSKLCSNALMQRIRYCHALIQRLINHYSAPEMSPAEAYKIINS